MIAASRYRCPPESPKARPRSRTTREIPAASAARVTGFAAISRFEFVDHHGSGCSDGSGGWFFSCRSQSWDEAYLVRQAEPEFDVYIAFENPRYRPGPSMTEEAKARLGTRRRGVRNRARTACLSALRDNGNTKSRLSPSVRSETVETGQSGGETE